VNIGMGRHMIFGQIVIHDAAGAMIDHALLVQSHADAHNDAAENLTARRLGVEDPAGGNGAHHARYAHDAQLFIDLHLDEDR
jgi:hypothetical protein